MCESYRRVTWGGVASGGEISFIGAESCLRMFEELAQALGVCVRPSLGDDVGESPAESSTRADGSVG